MKAWLLIVPLCVSSVVLAASEARPVDVSASARAAQRVVVARVLDVQSTYEMNTYGDRLIVSNALMQVEETLKGTAAQVVTVKLEGGTVGDVTLRVSDMPTMNPGDRAVLFLEQATRGTYRLHRRGQGIMKLDSANRVSGIGTTLDVIKRQVRAAR